MTLNFVVVVSKITYQLVVTLAGKCNFVDEIGALLGAMADKWM